MACRAWSWSWAANRLGSTAKRFSSGEPGSTGEVEVVGATEPVSRRGLWAKPGRSGRGGKSSEGRSGSFDGFRRSFELEGLTGVEGLVEFSDEHFAPKSVVPAISRPSDKASPSGLPVVPVSTPLAAAGVAPRASSISAADISSLEGPPPRTSVCAVPSRPCAARS